MAALVGDREDEQRPPRGIVWSGNNDRPAAGIRDGKGCGLLVNGPPLSISEQYHVLAERSGG